MQPPQLSDLMALTNELPSDAAVESPVETSSSSASEPSVSALPYSLSRTRSNNLRVYELAKAGGSKHITQIKNITGDIEALQSHLRSALNLPETFVDPKGQKKQTVTINWTTKHITVRGWRGPEIRKWAELVGF